MKVLVDSSFLIHCAERGKDLIALAEERLGERLECYLLEEVLKELRGLSARRGRRAAMASTALKIAEKMKLIKSHAEDLPTDEKLLQEAKRIQAAIATIDFELIDKARERGISILTVTRDLRIVFEGVRL